MFTIGIYDSGVGGLTVLAEILKRFSGNAIHYYADNAHAPLGDLDDDSLANAVALGLAELQVKADVCVIACNTASTLLNSLARGTEYENKLHNGVFILPKSHDKPAFKPILGILPPLYDDGLERSIATYIPSKTLLMATRGTKSRLELPSGIKVAQTDELATRIEEALERSLDMSALTPYLRQQLSQFVGVKQVILGCTHYPLCKKQIAAVLGRTRFCDGTQALVGALGDFVSPRPELSAPIKFSFSGKNEEEKYSRLLELLVNGDRALS